MKAPHWELFYNIESEVKRYLLSLLWKVKEMDIVSKKAEEDTTKTSVMIDTRCLQDVHVSTGSNEKYLNWNQVEGGEGLDVLQGCRHRPHLHPPLCHRLHPLHLPGAQRVTIRFKDTPEICSSVCRCNIIMAYNALRSNIPMFQHMFLLADATPWTTMQSPSLQSGAFHLPAWQFFSK